ncbi:MAG: nuclear transport factor 2 family protein [Daejeonella sp.]|nr:nuclear transport factor 2 family protein [Daejeonella sp.]
MAADLEKALLQTHKDLIDAIFHRGNDPRNRLLDLMSPKLHGCGTARHETIQSIDDYLSIFDGEINELPVGLVDRPVNLRTTIIENVGIVHGAYELLFKIENQNTSMYVRLTVVYEHRNKKWQAIHLHGSEPSAHIAEGETWPAEALKAQNEELQKTITEKTADLEQKNKNLLIEVALEKVRSRTMAMHNSSELAETTEVLHQQLLDLGIHADRTTIAFPDETSGVAEFWSTNQGGVKIDHQFKADLTEPHQGLKTLAGWKRKLKSIVIRLEGEELRAFLDYYKEKVGLPIIVQITKKTKRDYTSAYFSHGWITLVTFEPLSHEKISILERFAAVFNLTYTRFLDLQKAEAQTREAKIEASLERVRSKAMSMHGSRDLADTISMFYHELELFSITPRRCGVGLLDRETQMAELSTMNTTEQGNSIEIIGKLKMADHPVLQGVFDHWILQKEYHPVLRGHEIKDYYQLVRPQIEFPDYPHDEEQFGYFFFFPEGGVYAWTDKELGENELKIYRRFTTVLSLTYKRYKDIKEAEAQAREAQIELGLERVRARAMAMQNSEELKELISTVFAELTKLDLVLTRCLIMIYDPKTKDSTWWMANSEAPSDSIGLFVQYHEQPPYLAYIKAWQQQNLKWQYILEGKVKKQWDDFLFNETELSD